MKNNLGKAVTICLLFTFTTLFASDFSHDFKVSKQDPYKKEAVILTLNLTQTNHDVVLLFDFDLVKSKNYFFQRLNVKETDTHHDTKVQYTYLLYPLKDGALDIHFKLTQKVTNDESVAYSFSGDRDNVKGLVTVDTQIDLSPLRLNVKALPKETLLVGDFTLSSKFTKHEVNAYEPIPFEVSIQGSGYPPVLNSLLKQNDDFTLFEEKAIVKTIHTQESTKSTVTYPMALSAARSFDLENINIKVFNPKTDKSYVLSVPAQHFIVRKVDISKLVDKSDNPERFSTDFSWLTSIFSYFIVFGAGFLTAIIYRDKKRTIVFSKKDPDVEKIAACKNEKELFTLLIARDAKKHSKVIEKLEEGLYKKGKLNFKKLKEEAIKNYE